MAAPGYDIVEFLATIHASDDIVAFQTLLSLQDICLVAMRAIQLLQDIWLLVRINELSRVELREHALRALLLIFPLLYYILAILLSEIVRGMARNVS